MMWLMCDTAGMSFFLLLLFDERALREVLYCYN